MTLHQFFCCLMSNSVPRGMLRHYFSTFSSSTMPTNNNTMNSPQSSASSTGGITSGGGVRIGLVLGGTMSSSGRRSSYGSRGRGWRMRLLPRRNSSSWEDEDGDGRGVDVVEYHSLFGLALLSEVSESILHFHLVVSSCNSLLIFFS